MLRAIGDQVARLWPTGAGFGGYWVGNGRSRWCCLCCGSNCLHLGHHVLEVGTGQRNLGFRSVGGGAWGVKTGKGVCIRGVTRFGDDRQHDPQCLDFLFQLFDFQLFVSQQSTQRFVDRIHVVWPFYGRDYITFSSLYEMRVGNILLLFIPQVFSGLESIQQLTNNGAVWQGLFLIDLAAHKSNATGYARRIPTRLAAATGVEAELLQVSLALAFTIQQKLGPSRAASRVADFLAEGIHPAFERIVTCARNLTEASGAALALGDPNSMICVARSGASAPPIGAVFDAASGLSGESVRTGETTICVNAAADPRVNYQACRALNVASMLYFPLRSAQGQMIGMLGVFSPRPRHFSARDIACLRLTEGLVQEAIGRSTADPDPATLGILLKQADFVEDSDLPATPTVATVLEPARTPAKLEKPLDASAFEAASIPVPVVKVVPPTFVGRIVDESVADLESEGRVEASGAPVPEPRSRISVLLALIVALLIAAAVLVHNRAPRSPAPPPQPAETKAEPAKPSDPAMPQSGANSAPAEQMLTAQVSLRSTAATATVTILLPKAIRFEGYQLSSPDRIYFDLHNIRLTDAKGNVFKTDEGLISRVRLSDYASDVTRVVFDLRQPATFEARLEAKPDRLIIEMRRTSTSEKNVATEPGVPTRVTLKVESTRIGSGS